MKNRTNTTLRDVKFYNTMLNAYANGDKEFIYAGKMYNRDDAYMDFFNDLNKGRLIVNCKIK